MNEKTLLYAENLVPKTYLTQGKEAIARRDKLISNLLSQRSLPDEGWNDSTIEYFLDQLSMMDTNNFLDNCGVGEREGRVYSSLVKRRHYNFAHGIGRSGDVTEIQPKAAGSSLLNKLTNAIMLNVLHISGMNLIKKCCIIPMATGMSMTLSLLSLKSSRPLAKYVIWPRIDQKTCLKCIITAGYEPIIISNIIKEDELSTNMELIKSEILRLKPENILCVLSTTSCFAPRTPDNSIEISKICKEYDIPHIINNAYGIQSSKSCHISCRYGRVDLIISSLDKNFMIPVGGSIVYSSNELNIEKFGNTYPGRASGDATLDILITILSMGKKKYLELLKNRKIMYEKLHDVIVDLASEMGEKVLNIKHNDISMGITLDTLPNPTEFGSQLFTRCVTGSRVVLPSCEKDVCGIHFRSYGSHIDDYPHIYMTVAAAIGITEEDISTFKTVLLKLIKHNKKVELKKTI